MLSVLGQVFAFIQLVLKLLGLWEQFNVFIDKERIKEAEERRQKREKAAGDLINAGSEDEFDKAQSDIVDAKPKP